MGKIGKDMNSQITKEDPQMMSKHLKKILNLLVMMEMEIKATMYCPFNLPSNRKKMKLDNGKHWWGCEVRARSCSTGWNESR